MYRRCPGDLIDLWLGVLEVGEADRGEHFVDAPLEQAPDRTNAAGGRRIAALIVHPVKVAIHLERHMLGRLDDILHTHVLWRARKQVSAARTPDRLDESRAPQAQQDLLDVVVRKAFLLGELARGDGTLPRTLGEMDRNDQAVLRPGCNAHGRNMRERLSGFKLGADTDSRLKEENVIAVIALEPEHATV